MFVISNILVNQIDIWHVIEAIREQSLNQVAPECPVDLPKVAALLTVLYTQVIFSLTQPSQKIIRVYICGI